VNIAELYGNAVINNLRMMRDFARKTRVRTPQPRQIILEDMNRALRFIAQLNWAMNVILRVFVEIDYLAYHPI
jgi:hypothetical protein